MPKKATNSNANETVAATEEVAKEENPFAEYNNKTIQSFVKNNFADKITHSIEAPNRRINDFISRVDLTKDYQRKITTMTRLKTTDYVGEVSKKIPKEFLVFGGSMGWQELAWRDTQML
jgi:hypothetical protein